MKTRFFRIAVLIAVISAILLCAISCGETGNDTVTTDPPLVTTTPPEGSAGNSTTEETKTPEVTGDVTTSEATGDATTSETPAVPDVTTSDGKTDNEAPVLNVDSVQESVLSEGLTVTGTVSDNTAVKYVTVGGVTATVNSGSFTATVTLNPGDNELEVVACDTAGNLSEKKIVKVTYVKYLNNIMEKDNVLTVYNSPACAASHQDGFVFIYNGEIYLLDGGMTDTSAGSTYNYLKNLRSSIISGTKIAGAADMKLQLNLIVSHFHYDHVQALIEQIIPDNGFEIASIYYTKSSVYTLGSDADERASVFGAANMADAKKYELDFGKTETITVGDVKIKLYAPSEDWGKGSAEKIREIYYPSKGASYACADAVENANSMWMKLTYGGKSMLFTGDVPKKMHDAYVAVDKYVGVGGEPFDVMISYYGKSEFDVDVIKFPHHGSERTAAMYSVCEVMSPDLIIFTSLYNEYRPVVCTIAGRAYKGSYASSALDGMTMTLTSSGKLVATRAGKTENVYGDNGEYLGICGELFEERSAGVKPSASLSGKGTESDPYLIGTREDLAYFAENYYKLCGDNGAHFKLTADIVWSDYKTGLLPVSNWTPIGSPAIGMKPFTGTFDGDGHSISGIYCAGCKEGEMIFGGDNYYLLGNVSGFFGAVNGTVKNLIIKDSSFYGNRMVGAIVAHTAPGGNTSIINCASYALVQGFEGVGGIFGGYFQRASYGPLHDDVDANGTIIIDKCVNFGTVNSISTDANSSVGGIVGSLREMKKATITECANYGNVTSSGGCVGGIVGQAIYCDLTMKNCVNSGTVVGLTLVGGVVGKIQNESGSPKTVECLINYGAVGATKDGRVGLINGSSAEAKYHGCFNGKGCYYLSTAMLVTPSGVKAVTDGSSYAAYYTAKTASELSSLNLDTSIWASSSNVAGAGNGLPTIKSITVVKLYN